MKQIRLILCCVVYSFCSYCYAQEYTIEEIKHDALAVLNGSVQVYTTDRVSASQKEIQSVTPINRDSKPYLYIVNAADSAGWVIVSNEQRYTSHIIGYNENGTFSENNMPPALKILLEQHMNAIDSVRIKGIKERANENLALYPNNYVSPKLLGDNMWKQTGNNGDENDCSRVYNKYAVKSIYKDDCGIHAVGCGAVAMGQIMRYWHWPDYAIIRDTIIGGVWYGGKNLRWYDWDNMPDTITDNSPMVQVDAIAGLLRDCGYAAHTTYHKDGSLALFKDIHSAMEDIFHYHATREHEYEWTEIAPKLQSEIDANRPVLCQARRSLINAHSFVIDGYYFVNNQLKFHINFGWGHSNGYYDLNFNGYDGNRTFLTEIYPDCSARNDNVYLATNETVKKDKIFNFYTANDIYVCHNNNSIVVENGGKMLLRAGNSVTLKPGFQAKAGSNVEISIRSSCMDNLKRFAPRRTNNDGIPDETDYLEEQIITDAPLSVVRHIDRYIVYNASGQLVQTAKDKEVATNTLPSGFYAIQTLWDDGSISVEKVIKQ